MQSLRDWWKTPKHPTVFIASTPPGRNKFTWLMNPPPQVRKAALLLLVLLPGCCFLAGCGNSSSPTDIPESSSPQDPTRNPALVQKFFALEAERKHLDETIWAGELLSHRYEQIFIDLWDQLRANRNQAAVLGNFAFGELLLPIAGETVEGDHQILFTRFSSEQQRWTPLEWRDFLHRLQKEGYQLEQTEWRHPEFNPNPGGQPVSRFAVKLHLLRPKVEERIILRGNLWVTWSAGDEATMPGDGAEPFPEKLALTDVELLRRSGPPPFQQVISRQVAPDPGALFIDPIILYDLSGNGLSEIVLLCKNLVYWNHGEGQFQADKLTPHFVPGINTGIIADFDGDGIPDLLCADLESLLFYRGAAEGKFPTSPRRIHFTDQPLMNPFVMTAGDIDGDGDLDVWLAQYKVPYLEGQMPAPYYNANDGFPSFLLLNDGQANFTDATESSGLAPKRFRRTYSSSFLDVNGNGHLDLVVASDFAGVDLYFNNGQGRFTDVTARQIGNPHSFGMAHSFGDYNRDGRLDILVIGMNSYVAERLHHLGLGPPEFPGHQARRLDMAYGNRLYLGADSGFIQTRMSDQIARSGWSWGVSSFDFDNNGLLDVYIVNGHKSRLSARDYESQFWRHDIYAATSEHDPVLDLYFRATATRLYGLGYSYGGYEKNHFFLNQSGQSFLEAAYLFGLASERDCRNLVSDDLDGDGRMDLIFTVYEEWPRPLQELHVFRNQLPSPGNWIGVQLREHGNGFSPVGATIILKTGQGSQTRQMVTGDSYRSQHASTAHFGLGNLEVVEQLEIRWPNGVSSFLEDPGINRYHQVRPAD
jgi:enediyne biosynthesis protein E4